MLTHFVKALFGTRKPSALARAALAQWDDWLHPIDAASTAGVDPTYDDDFQALRDEVAKLSNVNTSFIVDTATRLLTHTAKDVRIAAYYVYGRMRRDGAEGVAAGLELVAALVDRFGKALLPSRIESRKAAIEWLAGDTFSVQLDQVQGLTRPLLERTVSAIALITEQTAAWPEAGRPDLGPLLRRFESRLDAHAPSDTPASGAHAALLVAPPASVPLAPSPYNLVQHGCRMAAFMRTQADPCPAAWRLMRCIRWDMLDELPPHDARGKTRLPEPRADLRSHLKRLLLQKHWSELLEHVDAAFVEEANHFWLDLQHYAYVAQEHAGERYFAAREATAMDCALLLQRLPGLEHLSFRDGTPFADSATLEWIARHATVFDANAGHDPLSAATPAEDNNRWAELEVQALTLATQQGLDQALAWLHKLPGHESERQRFLCRLVMARVAERTDRPDMAKHLLTALDDAAGQHRVAQWEPALAFDVKHLLMRVLRTLVHRKDADKSALTQRIDALLGDLALIDPARAALLK